MTTGNCLSSFRVVGGFETLTAMENVESDPKTDRPKVTVQCQEAANVRPCMAVWFTLLLLPRKQNLGVVVWLNQRFSCCSSLLLPGRNTNSVNDRFCWSIWRGGCPGEDRVILFGRPELCFWELGSLVTSVFIPACPLWRPHFSHAFSLCLPLHVGVPWPTWVQAEVKHQPFSTASCARIITAVSAERSL